MAKRLRRRSSRKRVVRRRRPTVRAVARQVRRLRPEVKDITWQYTNVAGAALNSVSYGSNALGATGVKTASLCSSIAQGAADGQRIGNKIRVIGLKIDFAAGAGDNYNNLRLLIVKPKSGYLTQVPLSSPDALVTSILSNAPSSAQQWLQPVDTERYHVLYDQRRVLRYTALNGTSNVSVPTISYFKKFIKLRSNIQWDKQGNIVNDYILVCISDSEVIAHPGMIAGYMRLYYTDN